MYTLKLSNRKSYILDVICSDSYLATIPLCSNGLKKTKRASMWHLWTNCCSFSTFFRSSSHHKIVLCVCVCVRACKKIHLRLDNKYMLLTWISRVFAYLLYYMQVSQLFELDACEHQWRYEKNNNNTSPSQIAQQK